MINDDVQDLVLSHAHYVERFKTFEVRRLQAIWERGEREIREKLLVADIKEWSRARYEKQLNAILGVQKVYNREWQETIRADLKDFGGSEAQAVKRTIDSGAKEVLDIARLKFVAPSPAQVWAAAKASPLMLEDGTAWMLEEFLKSVGQRRLKAIEDVLRYSFTLGEGSAAAAKRLVGTPDVPGLLRKWTRNKAEAVARTAMAHLWSVAHSHTYHENDDIVSGYVWLSTLDTGTTPICRHHDGRVWYFDPAARARAKEPLLEAEVYPPAHIKCRSTTTGVVRSWRELGIPRDELAEGMRQSASGMIPRKTTYYEWLQRQGADEQRKVLGVKRYEMWRAGEITPDSFHATDGRMLTLKELEMKGFELPRPEKAA